MISPLQKGTNLHIARFHWHLYFSGNLWLLKEHSKLVGGKILDENGKVVYDPGFEFDQNLYQKHYETLYSYWKTCIG